MRGAGTPAQLGEVKVFSAATGDLVADVARAGDAVFAVAISPTDKAPITVLLKPATTLPTVVVTDSATKPVSPRLRAFEEHRKAGFGRFVGEDDFRKNDNMNMADLMLARMPGLQTVMTSTGATLLVSTRVGCKGLALSSCQRPNCRVRPERSGRFCAPMAASPRARGAGSSQWTVPSP